MTENYSSGKGVVDSHASRHYDATYFGWQKEVGSFGGWANSKKFKDTVKIQHTVVDFGCGGGFLLGQFNCTKRIGIEPNDSAVDSILKMGILRFPCPTAAITELGPGFADVVISNNALEHVLHPLNELKDLYKILKPGGVIHFYVPCESVFKRFRRDDVDHHLYSWSPQNIGNLFEEAGFTVEYARPFIHKWPPFYKSLAKLGWPIFNLVCRIYGRIDRKWFQVEIKGFKPVD